MKLTQLTDQKSIDKTREANAEAWKGHLSIPQYLLRDIILSKSPMSKTMRVYALHHESSPDDYLSSVELVIRDGYRYDPTSDGSGKPSKKLVKMGCIGGVFTSKQHRGKGYAEIMINELNKICDNEGLEFVVLYSEVGEYYSRCGYESFHVPIRTRLVNGKSNYFDDNVQAVNLSGFEIQLIDYHNFEPLIEWYNNEDDKKWMNINDGQSRVTFVPNEDVINWFHLRVKYFSHGLISSTPITSDDNFNDIIESFKQIEPKKFGLKVTKHGELVGYVIWTYEFNVNPVTLTCNILHMYSKSETSTRSGSSLTIKKLMSDLVVDYMKYMSSMNHWDVDKVKVWSSDVGEEFGGVQDDNSSLSAIRFNKGQKGIIWENNNKLPWF